MVVLDGFERLQRGYTGVDNLRSILRSRLLSLSAMSLYEAALRMAFLGAY
jgi:hypothetical protein